MTNVSSGSKRTWEGSREPSSHKRPRDDARDRRDTHLRSPRRPSPHRRRDSRDSRDYGGRNRDFDRHRSTDYGRDRDRRDDRERDRGRSRRDDYSKGRNRSRDNSSHRERTASHRHSPQSPIGNGKTNEPSQKASLDGDSEKEEGE